MQLCGPAAALGELALGLAGAKAVTALGNGSAEPG